MLRNLSLRFCCDFIISYVGWWSNLVFDVTDLLMVKPISHTSNCRYEEYCPKPNLLFVLVVSVDLKFGQEVFPG